MSDSPSRPASADDIRRWAGERSPQPFRESEVRPPAGDLVWLYGPGQYELAVLARLVDEGFAANRHVHYTRNHGRVAVAAVFRTTTSRHGLLSLRVSGAASVTIDGRPVIADAGDDGVIELELPGQEAELALEVVGDASVVPALALGERDSEETAWQVSLEGGAWTDAGRRRGSIRPPHLDPTGSATLAVRDLGGGVLDVGAPVLGRPVFAPGPRPFVASGESPQESEADPGAHETRHDVVALPDGGWTTRHRLGFRYLRTDRPAAEVRVEASVPPAPRAGAFACSDERLTRIWGVAQYTLRTCAQGILIDGIKRDRMPWAGDQAMSTLVNAFALGDAGLVADGLVALGRPGHGYVNGISDYSLWWVVNADLYVRYFGDAGFVEREAQRVHDFVGDLAQHAGADGVFRPLRQAGGFVDAGPGSVFIDWGVELEHGRDAVALQMLWYWALRSAQRVLERAAHPGVAQWAALAERLETTLRTRAWAGEPGRWTSYLDSAEPDDAPYANFLALLAGIHDGTPPGVRDAALGLEAGTPFMNGLRLRALLQGGDSAGVLDEIRRVWGGMLDRGYGTFWEEATVVGDPFAMYGRPFGRSLCHAWSAGPAAIIPEAVLGIRPLGDGWSSFTVDPALGELEWASLVVPTPVGDIVVVADRERVEVEVPVGATLVHPRGHEVGGPARVAWVNRAATDRATHAVEVTRSS
ncbi:alpha-L-rhamnosidase C-terminal domain-containing protein [Microbacterium sp. NPDC019599]|uniref:alpha-L-rhamnosidase-related protein n=1 Tax=Microbacterium sp. NPDC019599 TaxID=3154690 RepID=UPI003402CC2D